MMDTNDWDTRHVAAVARYNARFDNDLYRNVTRGKSIEYCNALIDTAMAFCGCPYATKRVDPHENLDVFMFLVLFSL